VSAVGHEIDFTIADFVADLRAPTPSAAAEMVVPDRSELLELIRNYEYTMRQEALQLIESHRERVQSLLSSYAFNRPKDIVREYVQKLDELMRVQDMQARHLFEQRHHAHESLHKRLAGVNPQSILQRGYAIVRRDDAVITRAERLMKDDDTTIQFQDGSVKAKVQ
jgi:exodeoxyribonuclease VII large subunit